MNHIIYRDEYFQNGQKVVEEQRSKVYGMYSKRYPSGNVKMLKVWSARLSAVVAIRADHQLVSVID